MPFPWVYIRFTKYCKSQEHIEAKWSIYASVSIGSGNGFAPVRLRHQDITWTNADSPSVAPIGAHFSEIVIKIRQFP